MILLALTASVALQTSDDPTWRDLRRAASVAIRANDTAAYRDQTAALQHIVGTTPRIAEGLAIALLALHDTVGGIRWSRTLAAMGLPLDTGIVASFLKPGDRTTLPALIRSNAAAQRTVDRSKLSWRLPDPDMIPEDLVYDPAHRRTLVSSVRRGSITAIDARGRATTFVAGGAPGVWGIFALGVDAKHNTLWATTAAFPGTARFTPADSGKSALLEYDLQTGALRRRIVPPDGGAHALGDLRLAPDGTVYVGDGTGGAVYALERGATALHNVVPAGTFSSPQNPALSADGRTLFVADYTFGIAAVTLATGRWRWIKHADSLALTGIDGMYRIGADLLVVQNGLEPNRIMRLTLASNDRIARATPVVRGGGGEDLNHAMIHDGLLYFIAKSGWDRYNADGTMKPAAKGDGPVVRTVPLTTHDSRLTTNDSPTPTSPAAPLARHLPSP